MNDSLVDYNFCIVKDSYDKNISHGIDELNWEELIELFRESFTISNNKKLVPMFIPVSFKPESEWRTKTTVKNGKVIETGYRISENVDKINFAVIDCDKEGVYEKAIDLFKQFKYLAYPTYSYSKAKPHKYRIIFPLEKPLKIDRWKKVFGNMVQAIGCDNINDIIRGYYLPSAPLNGLIKTATIIENKGRLLNENNIGQICSPYLNVKDVLKNELRSANSKNNNYVKSKRKDFSYDSYVLHYQDEIRELNESNQRNNFLQKVIYKEVGRDEENINLYYFIQFLHRAASNYTNKALHQGNSCDDIKRMIGDSLVKFVTHLSLEEKSVMIKNKLREVDNINQEMEQRVISKNWNFPCMSDFFYEHFKRNTCSNSNYLASNVLEFSFFDKNQRITVLDNYYHKNKESISPIYIGQEIFKNYVELFKKDKSIDILSEISMFLSCNTSYSPIIIKEIMALGEYSLSNEIWLNGEVGS